MTDERVRDLDGFNVLVSGRDATYLTNKNDAYVGRSLILYGEYGEAEFQLLQQLVRPGACVVEVGANCGAHSVRLAKHIGGQGRLMAIEPQPPLFQCLAGTMALNSLMNVDCLPYALGSTSEQIIIPALDYRAENNFGGISLESPFESGVIVEKRTLDDIYALPRLDVLKIDVEGMELDVLIGGGQTIERFKPIIYFENDRQEKSPEILKWLFSRGYRAWWHCPPLFNPGNFFANPENIFGGTASVNVLALPDHVNAELNMTEITDPQQFPSIAVHG